MKRLLSFFLLLTLLMTSTFVMSCTTGEPDVEDPVLPPTDPVEGTDEDEDARIALNLPDLYYGGEQGVHILQWTVNDTVDTGTHWVPWEEGDVAEYSDDMMQSAVFARNAWVEEQLGVRITAEYASVNKDYQTRLQRDFEAGSDMYQLATVRSRTVWPIISSGLYSDMNEYADTILHTDQPWWTTDAVSAYTLGDSLYACATEMLLRDKGSTEAVFFNTKIATDYELNYFYNFVEDGSWTLETLISAGEIVATSLDGDGMINSALDIWGMDGCNLPYTFFIGGGYRFAHIDGDGCVEYDFGSAETILAIQDIYETVIYADWNYNSNMPFENAPALGLFREDKALFATNSIRAGLTTYAHMETEYGILPTPKYTDDQDSYYSHVSCHSDSVIGIPVGAQDKEMAAMTLEMLSYEGYYSVKPLLYETMLLTRLAKSEESRRSVEIVLDTRTYDPGQYWDSEYNLQGTIFHLSETGNSNIASIWNSWESATMEQITKVNDFIDETR